MYIVSGSGTRLSDIEWIILKKIRCFFIGSNVPDMMRPDKEYDPNNPDEEVLIDFLQEIMNSFLSLPENKAITDLLRKAAYGISIHGETPNLLNLIHLYKNADVEGKRLINASTFPKNGLLTENGSG